MTFTSAAEVRSAKSILNMRLQLPCTHFIEEPEVIPEVQYKQESRQFSLILDKLPFKTESVILILSQFTSSEASLSS